MASRGTRLAAHATDALWYNSSTRARIANCNPSNPIGCSTCLDTGVAYSKQDVVLTRVRIKRTYMPDSEYDPNWINTEILACMLMRSLTFTLTSVLVYLLGGFDLGYIKFEVLK